MSSNCNSLRTKTPNAHMHTHTLKVAVLMGARGFEVRFEVRTNAVNPFYTRGGVDEGVIRT